MNRKQGIRRAKKFFNHIALYDVNDVCRLIGFEDSGEDFYWICRHFGGEVRYHSCVGHMQSMKKLNKRWYKYVEEAAHDLWLCPREEKLRLEIYEFDSYEDMIAWCKGDKTVVRRTIKE